MRQNEVGGAFKAIRIAARITAGCVTTTVRKVLSVNDSSQSDTRSIEVDDGLAAVRRRGRIGQPQPKIGRSDGVEWLPAPASAIKVGQLRLRRGLQAQQLRGLAGPPLGSGQLASAGGDSKARSRFGLPTAGIVERFVGRKTPGRHGVGHRVRHQGQPDDLGHAAILDARPLLAVSATSRSANGAKTRPMVTHSTSWVASESNLNS